MVVVVDAGRPVTHREDTGALKDACVKAFCLGDGDGDGGGRGYLLTVKQVLVTTCVLV